ncbi:MAG: cobalt ECF transporter T component CbiQ [Candidatus Thiodiazotropha sp. (ex Monitilora ramsayi)]|nr:cobalt ECF transporter T component CbiQ [Candidatus Thiodiazotropha sp. (ex Monitilora ramsayi)]
MGDPLLAVDVPQRWLTLRDPRVRILSVFGFALVVLALDDLLLLMSTLLLAVGLAVAAGLGPTLIIKRLAALEGFMLVLCILLPFSVPGETWFRVGAFSATWEGLQMAVAILLKANTVVLALLALVGTMEPVVLGHALAQLKVPEKLVHLFLFTIRYLDLFHSEYHRLHRAMVARGFVARSDLHTWRSLGWLVGMLLVRSLRRSQRILAAMKCRGFSGRFYLMDGQTWERGDTLFALLSIGVMIGLLFMNGRAV